MIASAHDIGVTLEQVEALVHAAVDLSDELDDAASFTTGGRLACILTVVERELHRALEQTRQVVASERAVTP